MAHVLALYPGQGSQKPKMALDLYAASSEVRKLFKLASEVASLDIYRLLSEGTEDELKQTKATQLAVTLASRSAQLRLKEYGISFSGHAGFSLGELCAYASAGIFDDATLFQIILKRAELMDEETEKARELYGKLGMAAIIGLGYEAVTTLLGKTDIPNIYCSNDNGPSQVVLSGLSASIDTLKPLLLEAGAKRVIPLRVSGPFHTPLLEAATPSFRAFLDSQTFEDPKEMVISSVDGAMLSSQLEAKEHLALQLARPVRWTVVMQTLGKLAKAHQAAVAEVGYGTVLSGLWKNSLEVQNCLNLGEETAILAFAKDNHHE